MLKQLDGPWLTMGHYLERDRIVSRLGFLSYREYLSSGLWRAAREAVIGEECVGCDMPATQVHHRKYTSANMTGASTEFLVGLCGDCHRHIEFGRNKTKLTPTQADYRLSKLIHSKHKKRLT